MNIERIKKHTNAIIVPCKDKQEWLSQRTLGGSSSPNLYGCGYSSAYSMWSDFVQPAPFKESTERQQIGLGLEQFVCNLYKQKYGGQVEQWPAWTIARHPDRDYMHATPDAILFDTSLQGQFDHVEGGDYIGVGPGSFSVKTWSEYRQDQWADGSVPLYCQVQLQHELAVLNLKWGVIAVLFGAQRLERFILPRNDDFIRDLYEACQEFWTHVTNRIAPPIDESIASAEAFKRLHPNDNGLAVHLPAEADELMLRLEATKATIKAGEALEAGDSNKLRDLIGDHSYGVTPEGRIYSLKTTERKDQCCKECGAVTIPGTTYRTLRSAKSLPKGTQYSGAVIDYRVAERKQIPSWVKQKLFDDDNRCHWCRSTLTMPTATIEHLVPLSLGGTNLPNNLTLACEDCNQIRGNDATLTAEQIVAKKRAIGVVISSPISESPAHV